MEQKMKVGVAGSGAMGSGIAQVAAMAGHQVVIMDTNIEALLRSRVSIEKNLHKIVEKGKITKDQSDLIEKRIKYSHSDQDFADCGIVIEAIIEDLDVKKELFRKIEHVVDQDCIIATNTSSLSIAAIASSCLNRKKVIGIHFFNPANLMPLVEIIPALTTGEDVVKKSVALIQSWGKVTVIAKDTPGFIVNRVARPFYGEAIKILEEGIATESTIDWAMKNFGGFRMGPFELMDFIGNDVNYKVTETVWQQMFFDPRYRPSLTQKRLYEAGYFGRKSGQGYYSYDENSTFPEAEMNPEKGRYIFNRILAMLVNEAAEALYLNVASRDDLELAMTKGVNYPKGLLQWSDEIGVDVILKQLIQLQSDYGDDRYRPSMLLKKMAAEKRTFY